MSVLAWNWHPNKTVQVTSAPGDTLFHQITPPPPFDTVGMTGAGVEIAISCVNAAGTGAGSVIRVSFDALPTPTVGFPILPGQTLVLTADQNLWIAQSVASDVVTILWLY